MCRLFALLGAQPTPVLRPLLQAQNALSRQSVNHPDGWGVAWFEAGQPLLKRGVDTAHQSERFARAVRDARSAAILAHIRKASVGSVSLKNTHPFEHGGWVFAHNGTVRGFERRRSELERRIDRRLRAGLQGDTDSERCFFLFLSELATEGSTEVESAARALARTAAYVMAGHPPGEAKPTTATFIATNGQVLVAVRSGRELGYTTHRVGCPELGTWSPSVCRCQVRRDQPIAMLSVSSEATGSEHRWTRLRDGDVIGIDGGFRLRRYRMEELRATG